MNWGQKFLWYRYHPVKGTAYLQFLHRFVPITCISVSVISTLIGIKKVEEKNERDKKAYLEDLKVVKQRRAAQDKRIADEKMGIKPHHHHHHHDENTKFFSPTSALLNTKKD